MLLSVMIAFSFISVSVFITQFISYKQTKRELQFGKRKNYLNCGDLEYYPTYVETNSPMFLSEKKLSDRMVLDVFGTSMYELVMQIEKEVEEEFRPKVDYTQRIQNVCPHSEYVIEGNYSSSNYRRYCKDCGKELHKKKPSPYETCITHASRQIAWVISIPNATYMADKANGL